MDFSSIQTFFGLGCIIALAADLYAKGLYFEGFRLQLIILGLILGLMSYLLSHDLIRF